MKLHNSQKTLQSLQNNSNLTLVVASFSFYKKSSEKANQSEVIGSTRHFVMAVSLNCPETELVREMELQAIDFFKSEKTVTSVDMEEYEVLEKTDYIIFNDQLFINFTD